MLRDERVVESQVENLICGSGVDEKEVVLIETMSESWTLLNGASRQQYPGSELGCENARWLEEGDALSCEKAKTSCKRDIL